MTPRRRLLSSDTIRHLICLVAQLLVMAACWWLGRGGSDAARFIALMTGTLLGLALYGPLFMAVTTWAFRGLRGPALRDELRRSTAPRSWWAKVLGAVGPRTWAVTVSFLSLWSVWLILIASRGHRADLRLAGVACVLGTWVLLLAVFAVEYARGWARDDAFRFPDGDDERSLGDFYYVAIQASTTFSTSDVQVMTRRARTAVSVHALVAWLYSTVVVALVVSLAIA